MILCTKMNGNGNDFLIIDNMDLRYDKETLSGYAQASAEEESRLGPTGYLSLSLPKSATSK